MDIRLTVEIHLDGGDVAIRHKILNAKEGGWDDTSTFGIPKDMSASEQAEVIKDGPPFVC